MTSPGAMTVHVLGLHRMQGIPKACVLLQCSDMPIGLGRLL
jgi:hypothetical protein